LAPYSNQSWAGALINEKAGPEAVRNKLLKLAEIAEQGKPTGELLPWQFIRPEEAEMLSQKTGLDIRPGFSHVVDDMAIRHAFKEHGTAETELPRGQLPITKDDIAMIPTIIKKSTPEYAGKTDLGLDAIRYEKQMESGEIVVVEEVRNKRNQLAFTTMYKKKTAKLLPPSSQTSETSRVMSTSIDAGKQAGDLKDLPPSLRSLPTAVGPDARDAANPSSTSPAFTSETAEGMSRLADVEKTIGADNAEVKPEPAKPGEAAADIF